MIFHLYQRTITHNGRKVKAWYYWFYDNKGKQIRRSCGQNKKPCFIKRDAQAYIEHLEQENKKTNVAKVGDYRNFYDENSSYLMKKKARGVEFSPSTLAAKRYYLNVLCDNFGDMYLESFTFPILEEFLVMQGKSNSWKNLCISVYKQIMTDAYKLNKINKLPYIEAFKNKKGNKGIFSKEELISLFPAEEEKLIDIWGNKTSKYYEIYAIATSVMISVTTGMRLGEVLAIQPNQIIENNLLLVNKKINLKGEVDSILKTGNKENKKWRIVLLPEITVKMINRLRELIPNCEQDTFLITKKNQIYKPAHFSKTISRIIAKLGYDKRNITFHSFRYMYNTFMRGIIEDEILKMIMGHKDINMTNYYDINKNDLSKNIPLLKQNFHLINDVFSFNRKT